MYLKKFIPDKLGKYPKYFLLAMILSGFGDGIILTISQLYFVSYGFTSEQIANIFMFKPLGTALITIPAGILADKLGKRKILAGGFTLFLFGFIPLILTTNTMILSLSLFLIGLSDAAYVVLNPLYSSFFKEDEMDKAFSLMMFLNVGAISLGSITGFIPTYLTSNIGYTIQRSYWIMLVTSFIFFTARLPLFLLSSRGAENNNITTNKFTIKSKDIIAKFAFLTLLSTIGYEVFFSLLPFYVNVRFGVQSDAFGSLLFVIMLVSAGSNILSAQISNKFGTLKTIVLSYGLSAPFYLLMAWSPNFIALSTLAITRVAIVNLGSPLTQSLYMRKLTSGEKSTASSIVLMAQRFAQGFAAWSGGLLMSKVGISSPIIIGAGLYLLYAISAQLLLTNKI